MLESNQISAFHDPSTTFLGVRFLLLGFDSVRKQKIQSKLFEGGGVDAVSYGPGCTHAIVHKLVYDDPMCVNARKDGKILVTGLWVDHSFDVGMTVDPTSIIYRPVKDFNGIPGAKSMIVCLTGYQRQDREDIMTMVGLMGANFSKPLVANKVTHLICYKFEGEKYELAKKMKQIKLVNHLWLENCLNAWEILPETDYAKSGYELEIEAEAKDSEDETEDMASTIDAGRKIVMSSQVTRPENSSFHHSPLKQEMSRNGLYSSTPGGLTNVIDTSKVHTTPRMDNEVENSPFSRNTYGHIGTPSARSSGINSKVASSILDEVMTNGKADHIVTLPSKSAKKSPSTNMSTINSKSIVRSPLRKPSLSPSSGRIEGNSGRPSTPTVSGSSKLPMEMHQNGTDFHSVKTPSKKTNSQHHEGQMASLPKRKMTLPRSSLNSQKVDHDFRTSAENKSAVKTMDMLVSEFSVEGSCELDGQTSPMTAKHHLNDEASLPPIEVSKIGVVSKDGQECNQDVLKCYQRGSKKQTSLTNLEAEHHSSTRTGNSYCEVEMHQSDMQITAPPFLNTSIRVGEKSFEQADLNFSEKEHTIPPHTKKMPAKKTLGSRLSIGKGRTANNKRSIGLQKAMMQNDYIAHPSVAVSTEETNSMSIADKVAMENTDTSTTPTNKSYETHQVATDEDRLVDDDTEAPDVEQEHEFDEATNKGKMAEFEAPDISNMSLDERVDLNNIEKQYSADIEGMKLEMTKTVKDKNAASSKKTGLAESKFPNVEKILPKEKKRPAKAKRKVNEPEEKFKRQEFITKQDGNDIIVHNKETVRMVGKAKGRPAKKLKRSTDAEKENRPVSFAHQGSCSDTEASEKVPSKQPNKSTIKSLKVDRGDSGSIKKVHDHEVKNEHACFILSGLKLQRKEFQQVIKRLKGKVCRDSHNWSYQATHFIVPDPIRRTEKFFAAAASGSWILKMDYLTASNEAGKFLSEKTYEWHQKGLSEDGAINLEAPRKWRILRERTGHGAFYGMRIVIYGECIAPPLDTLKRVIKAGEGTILATSPPYSRFLQSGIDFAIVSPGLPRVDMWVQEFLRHEVPCVLADYLVDYVCKPGYSLDKHVQYNTQAWVEKSVKSLVSRVEEVSDEGRTPERNGTDDVACQVCESRVRGDEMILCGDESGTLGCGVGIHLDCLDPPLDDVPEEDWFCHSCSKNRECTSVGGSKSKRSSKSK